MYVHKPVAKPSAEFARVARERDAVALQMSSPTFAETCKGRLQKLWSCVSNLCQLLGKGDVLASVVAEHVFTSGHQMDLSKARVMDSHPHTQTWCLLESWHIQREQAPLNREKGMLPGIYTTLICSMPCLPPADISLDGVEVHSRIEIDLLVVLLLLRSLILVSSNQVITSS